MWGLSLQGRPEKILEFLRDLKPHHLFRKVIRNYTWDNLYREKLIPLISKVIGTHASSIA